MAAPASPRWGRLPAGFGNFLKDARVRAGLTRMELIAAIGVGESQLYGLEAELRPPTASVAGRLSVALGLDPWEDAVIRAVAVDDAAFHGRRGIRHTRPRRPRNALPSRASTVPTAA